MYYYRAHLYDMDNNYGFDYEVKANSKYEATQVILDELENESCCNPERRICLVRVVTI